MNTRKPARMTPQQWGRELQFRRAYALEPADKQELQDAKRDRKLRRMMNCRKVDKFDRGEHAFTPVAKPESKKFLDMNGAALYLTSGAVLISDCVTKERVIKMRNAARPFGFIRNDVMLHLFGKYNFASEKIPGTNKTEYRIA